MKRFPLPAVLFVVLSCAPARTVTVNGKQVPYEEAARDEVARAKASFDEGEFEQAVAQFGAFAQKYPDSELVDEAAYRRAQALVRAGKLKDAQVALQEFIDKRPSSPFKGAAALELVQVQTKLGQTPTAVAQVDT